METENLVCQYLSCLRSLALVHQNNHWQVHGSNFFSNHELFNRLYNEVTKDIDAAAEEFVGLFGADSVNLNKQMPLINNYCDRWAQENLKMAESPKRFLFSSWQAEKEFQELSESTYAQLKESGDMTLGLDDLIMSTHRASESRKYLLQQSLKE